MNFKKMGVVLVASLLAGCSKPVVEPTFPEITFFASTGSINTLERVTLGGVDQWILIQSDDISKPILLVLHGGPGEVMMPLLHDNNRKLQEHFSIVNWDQRGAGKSYSPEVPEESMTLEQLVADAHELTEALMARFGQEKIYLLGHSFGTVLGILLMKNYPDDYHAYVGTGQIVDFIENEQLMYDFAFKEARAHNDWTAIDELEEIGRPDEEGEYDDDSGYATTRKWVEYYGGALLGEKSADEVRDAIQNSEIYADDLERLESGLELSERLYDDEAVWFLDFRTQVTEIDVPVYFFAGHHDYVATFKLVEQYYEILDAPIKEIIWFEKSAHFPFYEEADKFNDVLINRVLAKTFYPKTDIDSDSVTNPYRLELYQ